MTPESFVAPLIALQFAAFGWRINRELKVEDENRKTWLPLPDFINVVAMLVVGAFCVVLPIVTGSFDRGARAVLSVGYVLIVFHPITEAAHYRLFSEGGRSIYLAEGGDHPWITGQEMLSVMVSIAAGLAAGYFAWQT
jgi:hypothetical protein